MDQHQCRGKFWKNFQDHWSIRISPGKGVWSLVAWRFAYQRFADSRESTFFEARIDSLRIFAIRVRILNRFARIGPLRYGPMIGPYEFPPKFVWTNGEQSSLKVSVLTGIGP